VSACLVSIYLFVFQLIYYILLAGFHFCRNYRSLTRDGPSTTQPLYMLKCEEDCPIELIFNSTRQDLFLRATQEHVPYLPEYEVSPPAQSFHGPPVVHEDSRRRRRAVHSLVLPLYELYESSSDVRLLLQAIDNDKTGVPLLACYL
jgi:hypothetical protein